MTKLIARLAVCAAVVLGACTGLPKGTEAVSGFELDRYLGEWFEIARLDHSFERGLDCVTANYSLREDGAVRVLNRGVSLSTNEVDTTEGKALFIGEEDVGRLKVRFGGPFYASYNILVLDEDYRWALVSGPTRSYLWILAREPQMSESELEALVSDAKGMDFPVDDLIFVDQGEACDDWR